MLHGWIFSHASRKVEVFFSLDQSLDVPASPRLCAGANLKVLGGRFYYFSTEPGCVEPRYLEEPKNKNSVIYSLPSQRKVERSFSLTFVSDQVVGWCRQEVSARR